MSLVFLSCSLLGNSEKRLFKFFLKQLRQYAVARTLMEDEITSLKSAIDEFFKVVNEIEPSAAKFFLNKNKIHMLKEHVLPFVQTFKSWGLFSEESIEAIHHCRNDLDDRIPGAGPDVDAKRNEYFMKSRSVAMHFG